MLRLFNKSYDAISLISVNLGSITAQIPVASISGDKEGPTALITAGNDGDEYASIAAAYRLIEEFSEKSFAGTLHIIPIVNILGFEKEMSRNPLDDLFPKHVYPGSLTGSSTERLRYWLSNYVKLSDFWMDLHGGSLTERVNPYVHAWNSPNPDVNSQIKKLIDVLSVSCAVYQESPDPVRKPTMMDCGYLMCESGSFGSYDETSILKHIDWVHTLMISLQMITGSVEHHAKKIYTHVQEYYVTNSGIWRSHILNEFNIQKGMIIGTVCSLNGKLLEQITAKQSGTILWVKEGMNIHSGDCVIGVGY